EPSARLVARHELTHDRDVRQYIRARRGGDSERAQPTSIDILNRADGAGKHDLHLPTEQIVERRPATTIWDVDHIDAGHHLEQLARDVAPAPGAGRCHVEFAGIGF